MGPGRVQTRSPPAHKAALAPHHRAVHRPETRDTATRGPSDHSYTVRSHKQPQKSSAAVALSASLACAGNKGHPFLHVF